MASNNYKAPPILPRSSSYDNCLKEMAIWQTFTDIAPIKQGSVIFLTLESEAREAVLELEVRNINCEDGVKNVLAKLDTPCVRDKVQTAYEAYDRFEKFCGISFKYVSLQITVLFRVFLSVYHYNLLCWRSGNIFYVSSMFCCFT